MFKVKTKRTGVKIKEHNVGAVKVMSHSEATHVLDGMTERYEEQLEVKEKKVKTPSRKVVYIAKHGGKATFDSVGLCAKIFGKDKTTIKYRIEHPNTKITGYDWLDGGHLEYINN